VRWSFFSIEDRVSSSRAGCTLFKEWEKAPGFAERRDARVALRLNPGFAALCLQRSSGIYMQNWRLSQATVLN